MARISTDTNEKVFQIKKWLGVNENPDGDTHLRIGEAAHMTNFRITDNGALQKRQGSQNVAGLVSTYTISVAETATTVATDLNTPNSSFTVYPTISVSDGGILSLSGASVSVNFMNLSSYENYYWRNPSTGLIYQLGACTKAVPATGTLVTGGSIGVSSTEQYIRPVGYNTSYKSYSDIQVSSGAITTSGSVTTSLADQQAINKFITVGGNVYKVSKFIDNGQYGENSAGDWWSIKDEYGYLVSRVADDSYSWSFKLVTATTGSTDIAVRGLWSGYVGCVEYLVAACNGKLWRLTEAEGVWTKTELGSIATTNGSVHMFGFDNKLYILDGTQYRVWNGTTLSLVTGYRPLVSVSNVPTGGGTALEQVNKLCGTRRAWFSPNGTATTFQLPEKLLTSIDYVKKTSDGTSVNFTADTEAGIVTISPALATGTNSLEIGWTVSTNRRAQVLSMRYSETYNGTTDTRIFLYGDGSNQAFYSGIEHVSGKPTAEYFPDLNVMAVDSANTPITALIKHYDRLIAYKSDGAFIINYGTITLSDNTTSAAFYVTPLNRDIGNVAPGQAVLVNNNPLTLFGRSVYEWPLSSYASKDERNAKRKSDKVAQTLSTLNLANAFCFDDEIHSEYYVVENGKACVYNYAADAWYIYDNLPATCMILYQQALYYGDTSGYIRHFSRTYMSDNGGKIPCYWESGSMDFGADFKRKYSANMWLGIKPEASGAINVTVQTDKCTKYPIASAASGFFDFSDLDFTKLSFGINDKPQMDSLKIKVKKFVYYTLILETLSDNTTATVTSADFRVRYTGNVR